MKLSTYNEAEVVAKTSIADGVTIDASAFKDERVALIFDITVLDAGATLTIEAGGAFSEGNMDAVTIPTSAVAQYAVCVETALAKDSDGNINIAVDTIGSLVGTYSVVQLP